MIYKFNSELIQRIDKKQKEYIAEKQKKYLFKNKNRVEPYQIAKAIDNATQDCKSGNGVCKLNEANGLIMKFRELLYKSTDNNKIENDITNWKNIFLRSIELLVNGYRDENGKLNSLNKKFHPNETKIVEMIDSFEDDLALIVFEYKLAFKDDYKGIRECKIFSTFLYHLLRIMPFNNSNKEVHISIFKFILKLISDNSELKIDDKNIIKFFDLHKFGYILIEKYASIDCIYSVCRQVLFKDEEIV